MGAGPPKVNAAKPGHGLGRSIDWLPDGRLLLTGKEFLRIAPDGSMVPHADLARLADFWNEIVVDARGNVYVNSIAFQFIAGAKPNSGIIALVTQDGSARRVAGGLGPDGICIDQEGTVWAQLLAWASTATPVWPLVLALVPAGFSSGLLVPTLTSEAISAVDPRLHGAATLGPLLGTSGSISHRFTLCLLIQPQRQTHPLLAGEKTTSRVLPTPTHTRDFVSCRLAPALGEIRAPRDNWFRNPDSPSRACPANPLRLVLADAPNSAGPRTPGSDYRRGRSGPESLRASYDRRVVQPQPGERTRDA